ncbi:unnamed protein product [Paramecium primaurelia]|uniref:Transmembrane protein n=1 Tax=Paramecium primaurelia TaxID=5886 RepID=A0A8S1JV36_PARPR|nr:unnamed protein product [Paramecium primaurelia]
MDQDSDNSEIYIIVFVIIFLVFMGIALFIYIRKKQQNRNKKLEEEINKLQQYVNSCDRKQESRTDNVNTQPQILSQTNSFTKTNRMFQQEQAEQNKQTGKMFLDYEKSEREIINQHSPHSQKSPPDEEEKKQTIDSGRKKVVGIKKKNLQIEIPQD